MKALRITVSALVLALFAAVMLVAFFAACLAARESERPPLVFSEDGKFTVFSHGGRVNTGICAEEWAYRGQEEGAGEELQSYLDGLDDDEWTDVFSENGQLVIEQDGSVKRESVDMYAVGDAEEFSKFVSLHTSSSKAIDLEDGGLVVPENIASVYDISAGDEITYRTADGTEISVPSGGITGVPALDSPAVISGSLGIAPDGGTTVETGMDLSSVVFTLEPFEPEFLYSLYGGVLSGITDFSVDMRASVSPDWHLDLDVSTDADEAVASAVRSQATALVSRVKERVREESSAYLASLTEQYSGEIQAFTSAVAGIQERFRSLEDIDTLVQERLEELEEKAKVYAAEKAAEALAPVQDAVESAVQDALDKLPVPVPSGGGTTEEKGESAGRLLDGLRKLF